MSTHNARLKDPIQIINIGSDKQGIACMLQRLVLAEYTLCIVISKLVRCTNNSN